MSETSEQTLIEFEPAEFVIDNKRTFGWLIIETLVRDIIDNLGEEEDERTRQLRQLYGVS